MNLGLDVDSKVTIVFVGFAILVGVINGMVEALDPLLGLALAILFFYVSYRAVPRILDLEETSFDTGAWNMIKTGAIPFWFLWLVTWTLIYTLRF